MAGRIRVLVVVIASLAAGFVPLAILGGEALWWAQILLIGSVPLIVVAVMLTVTFARAIADRPFRWAAIAGLAAVSLSVSGIWIATGSFMGIASLFVALPAVGAFSAVAKWWPELLKGKAW